MQMYHFLITSFFFDSLVNHESHKKGNYNMEDI